MVLLVFAGLSAQLYLITRDNGEEYKQKVLSQQRYDSTTIPFKRGNIEDSNGTILAVSNKVYNVILDTKILMKKRRIWSRRWKRCANASVSTRRWCGSTLRSIPIRPIM